MDDAVEKAYDAFPDRIFVVDEKGRIAVRAEPGPWGFRKGVEATRRWLASRFPDIAADRDEPEPTGTR
jgi:hypothetical protein